MAIAPRTAGTWEAVTATTQTVTLPTHQTGDMLLVRVGFKHATMPTTVTCDTAGWAKIGEANGTGASGNGSGGVQVAAFWKEAASGAETNPVITFNGGAVAATPSAAVAVAYSKDAGETWDTPVGDGKPIAAATNFSATINSHVAATAGDLIDEFHVTNDNTTLTVPTFTQAGLTLAAVVESPAVALSTTVSNDVAADGCYRIATAGTSSAAAVITGTNSAADVGAAFTTRLRVAAGGGPTPVTLAVSATLTPVVARQATYQRALARTATLTPVVARQLSLLRPLAVTAAFTPAIARQVSYLRSLAVTATLAPSLVSGLVFQKFMEVTSSMNAAVSRAVTFRQTLEATGSWAGSLATEFIAGAGGVVRRLLLLMGVGR